MMKPRSEASSFFYESQMVVTGGFIGSGRTDSIERMNIQDRPGHWMDFPVNLPGKMCGHKVVCYEDRLIVIGGYGDQKIFDAIHEIELVLPYSKKVLSRMPRPRYRHGVNLLKIKCS